MKSIPDLQNKTSALELLAAQRRLYSETKNFFYIRSITSSLVAIAFPFFTPDGSSFGNFLVFLSIIYLVLDFVVLDRIESKKRVTAAKIQEQFDTEVLGIAWNSVVVGERPDAEDVARALQKIEGDKFIGLRDWYPAAVASLPVDVARTVCQRDNFRWDSDLRRRFAWLLFSILLIILVITFFIVRDKTLIQIIFIVAPVVPLLRLLVDQMHIHRKAATTLDKLKSRLSALLEDFIEDTTRTVDDRTFRSIQDELYRHRSTITPIPDLFYNRLKNKDEERMKFHAAQFVSRYVKAAGSSS